jgi:competence protein ComEC
LAVLNPLAPRDPPAVTETDSNDQSVVLRLAWGQASVLLAGDIGADAENSLVWSAQPLSANVLRLAHHGSNSSSSPGFLTVVQPSYAVVSAGAGNRFSHPATAVLDRLAQLGATILRTDQTGTIELITDGRWWWVKTEH